MYSFSNSYPLLRVLFTNVSLGTADVPRDSLVDKEHMGLPDDPKGIHPTMIPLSILIMTFFGLHLLQIQ